MECCRSCGSIDFEEIIMPQGYIHYSRVQCKDCGKFIKWGKKPKEKQDFNNYTGGHEGMNSVALMGRLTKDPEVRYTKDNTAVCNFTIAVDRPYQKEGEEKETDFIPIIVWGAKGEAAGKYLEKGRRVGVTGRIQTRTWDDADGRKHYVTEIWADGWYFADDKKKESASGQPQQQQNFQTPPPQSPAPGSNDLPPWMAKR